jgi:cell division transport system permease protein
LKEELPQRGASAGLQHGLLNAYIAHHRQTMKESLVRLAIVPVSSLMTALVLSVALALPAGLYVFLDNVKRVTESLESVSQMTLYLQKDLPQERSAAITSQLRQDQRFAQVDFISSEQALEEFKTFSGWGDVLSYLDNNPLPAVIVVRPLMLPVAPDLLEIWAAELRSIPGVESVQVDMQWVKRLYSLYELLSRGILALSGLLAMAMVLIVGNTIRLAIESRREEIVVVKMVGGTDAYVRRPFLYTGFWYGLCSAILAWIMVAAVLWWLREPVDHLAALYASRFNLEGLSLGAGLLLLCLGSALGVGGAWLAVKRHLDEIEPS